MAHSWSKSNGLTELPQSASLVRTTKELLEGDFFERNPREKSIAITLVAQKWIPRTNLLESSDKEEDDNPYIKQKPRSIKREPQIKKEREPQIKKEREPQIKKEKAAVRSRPDPPFYPYPPQTPQGQSIQEPRAIGRESQTPSHKRSRNDLSSSEELPADALTYFMQTHGAVPTSSVRSLSDRTRTQSVHSSMESSSMLAFSRIATEPAFNDDDVQISATPTISSHRTKSQKINTAEDSPGTLTGRTRRQQRAINQLLLNQKQSKENPSKASKGKKNQK